LLVSLRSETLEIISKTKTNEAKEAKQNEKEPKNCKMENASNGLDSSV
jgi:hypothetical protein